MQSFREMRAFCVAVVLAACAAGCSTGPVGTPPPDISLGDMAALKQEAEYWARKLKSYYARDTPEYRDTERRYTAAAASVDGWVTQVKFNLQQDRPIPDATTERLLHEATNNTRQFVDYVNSVAGRGAVPIATITALVAIFKTLTDTGTAIADKRRQWREADVAKAVASLDAVKWQPFDALK